MAGYGERDGAERASGRVLSTRQFNSLQFGSHHIILTRLMRVPESGIRRTGGVGAPIPTSQLVNSFLSFWLRIFDSSRSRFTFHDHHHDHHHHHHHEHQHQHEHLLIPSFFWRGKGAGDCVYEYEYEYL